MFFSLPRGILCSGTNPVSNHEQGLNSDCVCNLKMYVNIFSQAGNSRTGSPLSYCGIRTGG